MEYEGRLRFFLLLSMSGIIGFLLQFLVSEIMDMIPIEAMIKLWIEYALIMVSTLIACSIGIFISKNLFSSTTISNSSELKLKQTQNHNEELLDELYHPLSLHNFPKNILYGLIVLTMVYLPLDCLGYILPGIIDFSAATFDATNSANPENYFLYPLGYMLITTIIIHILVAFREEFVYRNFYLTSGKRMIDQNTSYLYSASVFGLAHFTYIFTDTGLGIPAYFPIWWGLNAFIIGLVSAWLFLRIQNLWPVIIAHFGNNLISAFVIRFYVLNYDFWTQIIPWFYGPFVIIGLVIYIWKWQQVKHIISEIIANLKGYFENLSEKLNILLDLVIIILLWIVTLGL